MRAEYNYTYSGMLKTLVWWYEVKGNTTEKSNEGIGIIPFIYKNACDYYYALYLANLANAEYENYQTPVKEFHIQSPRVEKKKKKKLFKFLEDEANGN
jgi:UDP-N-acetylmuramyl pentapeptide synthase